MMRAAITPGIQPQIVKIKTIKTEPQPLSITARGGNKIESNTLQKFIYANLRLIIQLMSLSIRLLLQWGFLYISTLFYHEN